MSEINRIELEGLMHDWKSRAEEAEAQVAELARVTAERDEYRRALRYLVGNEWEESAGDTLSEKAMSTVIDRQAAELARLRAVIEEARAVVTDADETPEMIRLFLILDRGLKGAGE